MHPLDALIRRAEDAFRRGEAAYFDLGISGEDASDWDAEEVRIARCLVGEEKYHKAAIADYWEGYDYPLPEGEEDIEGKMDLYRLWVRPLEELMAGSTVPLAKPKGLFHLGIRTHGYMTSSFDDFVASALTETCGLFETFGGAVVDYPWFPMPVALINRGKFLEGVGIAMRAASGGTWMEMKPHEVDSSLVATDLYKVLLYASCAVEEEIWAMDIPTLAALAIDRQEWDYVDLINALGSGFE